MIYSYHRNSDMQLRSQVLDVTEFALRKYRETQDPFWLESAKTQGELSARLKKKIDTYDYTADDQRYQRVKQFLP